MTNNSSQISASTTLAWCLTLFSLVSFAGLSLIVSRDMTTGFDRTVLSWLRNEDGETSGPVWIRESLIEITALGGYPIIVLVMFAAVAGLVSVGKKKAALFLTVSVAGGSALSSLMKLVFDRPRPDLFVHLDQIYTSSFPSAHAMVSMVVWLTLALVMTRFIQENRLRILLLGLAIGLSLLIGFSRVFLGVHWPTDVLAGWLLGVAWACGSWLCAHYLADNKRRIGQYGRST
ncbi:phosphatase PAP2 family protein [Granulosicoccus sp. 3-233]|uniref:phosphatase PAP2 family protein n=1 Tax=Granulosicoccus sp. 3-233 TaxID=3417969 RepID=UPI003D32AAF0